MKELDKLPMDVVMALYRKKIAAENKGDHVTLKALETEYPDLFSVEFNDFISNLKMSIEYIWQRHGEDFREMVEPCEQVFH